MVKVSSKVRIPLKTIGNGSFEGRIDYAKKLNSEFYQLIRYDIKKGYLDLATYKKALSSILPKQIKIHLIKLNKKLLENGPLACFNIDSNENVTKYFTISLPFEKTSTPFLQMTPRIVDTIMHENFHLFSALTCPKIVSRFHFNNEKEWKFYDENLYTSDTFSFNYSWIFKTIKFLKTLPDEEKIDFLQKVRYRLQNESLAYQEGYNYAGNSGYIDLFNFNKKNKFIKFLLFQSIKKVREKHKKNIQKQGET